MTTRWLVFDYGEVLCSRTEAIPKLAARMGVPAETFEPAYWACRDAYDRGASDALYWQAVGATVGVDVDTVLSDELTRLDIEGWSHVEPSTVELLEALAEAGSALALLSNAPVSFARFAERQPWARHFRELVFSGDLGIAKPDSAIFEVLLARLGADPADCLFFDDKQANVDGARAAGLRAHRWLGPYTAAAV
ncbi:HAD family hydrolase [Prauserella muralis]|uniref:HAD family hydrolase n=1 Tax=Prauserella muralis TaxID=588067 RepID=A0A2V4B883_9PSEU|nr:HAD family phosphatase [Prauserella muralis]PXY31468.1 HAD family hydrolase [Prauserella muralis]TWE14189.1 putative hydrolase of the HAD superfamily [Prauserella muralis]